MPPHWPSSNWSKNLTSRKKNVSLPPRRSSVRRSHHHRRPNPPPLLAHRNPRLPPHRNRKFARHRTDVRETIATFFLHHNRKLAHSGTFARSDFALMERWPISQTSLLLRDVILGFSFAADHSHLPASGTLPSAHPRATGVIPPWVLRSRAATHIEQWSAHSDCRTKSGGC
jgi:hypothetical protein